MDEVFDTAEQAFMDEQYSVSNDDLVARVRSAPDMGGALLVQLSEFMVTRPEREVA